MLYDKFLMVKMIVFYKSMKKSHWKIVFQWDLI